VVCVLLRVFEALVIWVTQQQAATQAAAARCQTGQPTVRTADRCGSVAWVSGQLAHSSVGLEAWGAGGCWKQGRHGRVPLLHAQKVCLCGLLAQHDPRHCKPGVYMDGPASWGCGEQDSVLAKQTGLWHETSCRLGLLLGPSRGNGGGIAVVVAVSS
jgi:hypothetical protein